MAPIQGWRESLWLLSGWRLRRSKQHLIEGEVVVVEIVVRVQLLLVETEMILIPNLLLLSGWRLRRSKQHQIDPKPYSYFPGAQENMIQ